MGIEISKLRENREIKVVHGGMDAVHIVRPLTFPEMAAMKRECLVFKHSKNEEYSESKSAQEAKIRWWLKICVGVRGYTIDGADVMDDPKWRDIVKEATPLLCSLVVEKILNENSIGGEETEAPFGSDSESV